MELLLSVCCRTSCQQQVETQDQQSLCSVVPPASSHVASVWVLATSETKKRKIPCDRTYFVTGRNISWCQNREYPWPLWNLHWNNCFSFPEKLLMQKRTRDKHPLSLTTWTEPSYIYIYIYIYSTERLFTLLSCTLPTSTHASQPCNYLPFISRAASFLLSSSSSPSSLPSPASEPLLQSVSDTWVGWANCFCVRDWRRCDGCSFS